MNPYPPKSDKAASLSANQSEGLTPVDGSFCECGDEGNSNLVWCVDSEVGSY